ncbi:hypothetical protein LINPERHAP1_LOCUS29421 [Linum perenne]
MVTYWMNIFVLPMRIIKDIEKICSDFVWGVGISGVKKARVAWKQVSTPYDEGGANALPLRLWNTTCLARNIWNFLMRSGSLWVAWLNSSRLKNKDFWTYKCSTADSWMWKGIMKCRDIIVQHITQNIAGNWLWDGSAMDKFSMKRVLSAIRIEGRKVDWESLVWQTPTIPRYSFMAWQICLDRLPFNNKLNKWGLNVDDACFFCQVGLDNRDHTIGDCDYACWIKSQMFPSYRTNMDWDGEISWFVANLSGNSVAAARGRLAWRIVVSNLWKERCCRAYGESPKGREVLLGKIQLELGIMWSSSRKLRD